MTEISHRTFVETSGKSELTVSSPVQRFNETFMINSVPKELISSTRVPMSVHPLSWMPHPVQSSLPQQFESMPLSKASVETNQPVFSKANASSVRINDVPTMQLSSAISTGTHLPLILSSSIRFNDSSNISPVKANRPATEDDRQCHEYCQPCDEKGAMCFPREKPNLPYENSEVTESTESSTKPHSPNHQDDVDSRASKRIRLDAHSCSNSPTTDFQTSANSVVDSSGGTPAWASSPFRGKKKSCEACTRNHCKCSGGPPPCQRCSDRGLQCIFRFKKKSGPRPKYQHALSWPLASHQIPFQGLPAPVMMHSPPLESMTPFPLGPYQVQAYGRMTSSDQFMPQQPPSQPTHTQQHQLQPQQHMQMSAWPPTGMMLPPIHFQTAQDLQQPMSFPNFGMLGNAVDAFGPGNKLTSMPTLGQQISAPTPLMHQQPNLQAPFVQETLTPHTRRSCEECSSTHQRCPGPPASCSRCLEKGIPCVFLLKRKSGPKPKFFDGRLG